MSPFLAAGILLLSGSWWEVRSVIQNTSSGVDGDTSFLLILQLKSGKSAYRGLDFKYYYLRELGALKYVPFLVCQSVPRFPQEELLDHIYYIVKDCRGL